MDLNNLNAHNWVHVKTSADIVSPLNGTLIGLAGNDVALKNLFPINTANAMALNVASTIFALKYKVQLVKNKSPIPVSVSFVCEAPSSSGKSPAISDLSDLLVDVINTVNRKRAIARKAAKEHFYQALAENGTPSADMKNISIEDADITIPKFESVYNQYMDNYELPLFVANATPEAIRDNCKYSHGHYILRATEKDLIDTVMGGHYCNGKKSFGFILEGTTANRSVSLRCGSGDRAIAFSGRPIGSVFVCSQPGTVEMLKQTASNSGLFQRLLCLVEETLIGKRRGIIEADDYPDLENYLHILSDFIVNKIGPLQWEKLETITFDQESRDIIKEYADEMDEAMGEGKRYSGEFNHGLMGKATLHIMKVAGTLHVSKCLQQKEDPTNTLIDLNTTEKAILIVDSLLTGTVTSLEEKELSGYKAMANRVLEWFSSRGRDLKAFQEKEIRGSLKSDPLLFDCGNLSDKKILMDKALAHLISTGELTVDDLGRYRKPLLIKSMVKHESMKVDASKIAANSIPLRPTPNTNPFTKEVIDRSYENF